MSRNRQRLGQEELGGYDERFLLPEAQGTKRKAETEPVVDWVQSLTEQCDFKEGIAMDLGAAQLVDVGVEDNRDEVEREVREKRPVLVTRKSSGAGPDEVRFLRSFCRIK